MAISFTTDQINLFRSFFRGREDVFAIRWEKGKRAGYMPAYRYDPYMYRVHKMKGGSFKDYADKKHLRLTNEEIHKHLTGKQFVGIYPLLEDNTSWFIVADFDKEDWQVACQKLIEACKQIGISAYLERSRSGAGGHVWIFFDAPYPAAKSRKILKKLLEQTGSISVFDKNSSFDRLFPNQDFLSGKNMGNLIALPLHQPLLKEGKNCFVDPQTLQAYSDQWTSLKSIKRVSVSTLDNIHESFDVSSSSVIKAAHPKKLQIRLDNAIHLNQSHIKTDLTNFLKEELNLFNTEFIIKKRSGESTWGLDRYFNLIKEDGNEVILPRGFIGKLLRYCQKQKIDFDFQDQRKQQPSIEFTCNLSLRSHQKAVMEAVKRKEFGIIVAPPGSGKTVVGLKIIAEKQQPALIIVHRKQLMEQWLERIEAFLGIPKKEIGKIGQGRKKLGKQITIAMIQSLANKLEKDETQEWLNSFGILIVDECHHLPAKTFHTTVSKLNTYFQYGLTATPYRKYNDGKLMFAQLGEIIAKIKPHEIETFKRARIIVRSTSLDVPFNPKTDPFEVLSKILIHDTNRNKLILDDIVRELNKGNMVVIITERREHIQALDQFLKQNYETIALSGEDSESSRKSKWKLLRRGSFQVVITTGQYFGEGTDLQNVSRLFLVYPFSFKGKLVQYIGRVQRSEVTPIIYDYRDQKIEYLNRLFLKRNTYYRHLDKQATLFSDHEEVLLGSGTTTINEKIKIPIESLEFQYGAIAFDHKPDKNAPVLKVEIEHDYIRPEFEVLKPYFSKLLGSKYIKVHIQAEFENNQLVAQTASCRTLEQINRETIDGMRFKFFDDTIIGSKLPLGTEKTLLELNELQSSENAMNLYTREEELLEEVLKNKNVKHYKQLRFLAERHENTILKIRFVLNPFSFVFLLAGKKQYHIVLETLDTEEATYLWHIEKNPKSLSSNLEAIDKDLALIRNHGRQAFLSNAPNNFSKVIHNYSDERKGFILWRDTLEEKLY